MRQIELGQKLHDQILRWAICSRREINIVCFGHGRNITKVVRLRNPERFGRYTASINNREYRDVVKANHNLRVVACGHSHIGGPAMPSKGDMPPTITEGKIELIICVRSRTITAWKIHKTRAKTLKHGRIPLVGLQNDLSNRVTTSSDKKRKVGSSKRGTGITRKRSR